MLAAEKVPVLHMIGLKNEIVPPDENSLVLIDRYIRLGGPATVVPCTKGKQDLNGHHFEIETPELVADFIKHNTRAFRTNLKSESIIFARRMAHQQLSYSKGEGEGWLFLADPLPIIRDGEILSAKYIKKDFLKHHLNSSMQAFLPLVLCPMLSECTRMFFQREN